MDFDAPNHGLLSSFGVLDAYTSLGFPLPKAVSNLGFWDGLCHGGLSCIPVGVCGEPSISHRGISHHTWVRECMAIGYTLVIASTCYWLKIAIHWIIPL